MKILFLSFFYKPDLSAGSFRNTALVDILKNKIKPEDEIEVLTTMPNRYHTFKAQASETETDGNVTIRRIKLSAHKNGFADQVISYRDYYRGVKRLTKGKKYDLIYASSSKLFTAFLGARLAKKMRLPLYLDIRDIFTDTMNEVLKNKIAKTFILPSLKFIERYTVNNASHINFVSKGFENYFKSIYKGSTSFYTNGIDDEFLELANQQNKNNPLKAEKLITYAGNIGEGQGLEKIIPFAAKKLGNKYKFRIIGDGGAKKHLVNKLQEMKVDNVEILQPVNRNKLKEHYAESDFLFLHLNNYKAFEKVLPSKIFEYGATRKGIIAGVGGYANQFIHENIPDAILFSPGETDELLEKLSSYKPNGNYRHKFLEKFNRNRIMNEMAESILKLLPDYKK